MARGVREWFVKKMDNISFSLTQQPFTDLYIADINNKPLIKINFKTGDIECSEDYTPDKAAQMFWKAVAQYPDTQYKEKYEQLRSIVQKFIQEVT